MSATESLRSGTGSSVHDDRVQTRVLLYDVGQCGIQEFWVWVGFVREGLGRRELRTLDSRMRGINVTLEIALNLICCVCGELIGVVIGRCTS